ncbi:LRR domain containing protein, partial [Trema orientale]
LEYLELSSVSEHEILDLECISSPPYLLRFLSLRGPLQKLPYWISMPHNLLEIWLHFEEGGFQKLRLLNIKSHDRLKEVQIDREPLPCLQTLSMWGGLLREVPSGIQHLTNLKTLRFFDLPEEFVSSLKPCGGHDYWKVMHVPSVTFWKTIFGNPDVLLGNLRETYPINMCYAYHPKPV